MDSEHLPDATRVGRVALDVDDVPETTAFYRDVVGLAVLESADGRATLGAGETALLELRETDAPPRPETAAGLYHLAVRVPSRAALGDALRRVRDRWRLDGASDHRVSEALYLTDPDGNGVEVYCDRPRDEWPERDGRVAMDTLPLDREGVAAAARGDAAVPDDTDVGHVHLEVTSLDAARDFYVDALGMRVRQAFGPNALFVAAGDYHHHVGLNTWGGRTDPAAGRGLAWFELVVPGGALDAVRDRLAARGVAVTADDGLSVTDPDGIAVRLRESD